MTLWGAGRFVLSLLVGNLRPGGHERPVELLIPAHRAFTIPVWRRILARPLALADVAALVCVWKLV